MNNQKWIEWILRITVAGEFVGHGLLAVGGKADWVSWIQKFGVADHVLATQLLLAIGIFDVVVALIILVRPVPVLLLWATLWAFWTALVRPLVGVGWLDFVERSANWGAPLALLLLLGWPKTAKSWFKSP